MSVNASGKYRAVVVNNNDPLYQQRVTLNIPQILGNAESNWALPSSPTDYIPTPGQVVWASFDGGDVTAPVYDVVGLTALKAAIDSLDDSTSGQIAAAMLAAQNAQSTADGKATTFFATSPPTAEADGDLWIRTTDNHLFRWNAATSNWDEVRDSGIADALSKAEGAQETADGKIVSFWQTTAPATASDGDLWFDTDDGNKVYRWDATSGQWQSVQDATIAALETSVANAQSSADSAMTAAQQAQATADGAIRTYYQATAPWPDGATGHDNDLGDLWYDTAHQASHRWDGSSWALIEDDAISSALSAAQNAQNTADGKITSYYATSAPTSAEQYDLWYDTDDQNHPYYYDGTQWVDLRDGTIATAQSTANAAQSAASAAQTAADNAQSAANTAQSAANNAQSTADTAKSDAANAAGIADGKADVLIQSTAPTADMQKSTTLWIDTTNNANTPKRWDGTQWAVVTDQTATSAADAAAAAQSAADSAQSAANAAQSTASAAQSAATAAQSTADDAKTAAATAQTAADNAQTAANNAQSTADTAKSDAASAAGIADGKADVLIQSTAPTTDMQKDTTLWIDTTGGANTPKKWSGTAWVAVTDKAATDAANAAAAAQTAADNAQTSADNAQSAADAAQQAAEDVESRAHSRGNDLVTNGTGYLGTNYNFTNFTFAGSDAPTGTNGSFVDNSSASHGITIDELIPIDPTKKYRYTWQMRQTVSGAVARAYGLIMPLDAMGQIIAPVNYMYISGTTTTLAADLNPGDTVVHLTSAANWFGSTAKPLPASNQTAMAAIVWWDYVDKLGKAWPIGSYSRNVFAYGKWVQGGVDTTANTITLSAPYDGPAKKAGVSLSEATSGGSYIYTPSCVNVQIPETWTAYGDTFSAGVMPASAQAVTSSSGTGAAVWGVGLPPATALIKVGWLTNYPPGGGKHAVAAVSFSDVSAAQSTADTAVTNAANAQTAATNAQTAANNAKSAADAAQSTANSAQSAASKAQSSADSANQAALDASGLAGSKGKVIYSATAPTGDDANAQNLWINTADNSPNVWNGSAWVKVTDQQAIDAANAAATAQTTANNAQTAADNAQTAADNAKSAADAAQSTADSAKSAAAAADSKAVNAQSTADQAVSDAATAQSAADGKVTSYFQTTAPATASDGDLWFDTDNGNLMSRWDASTSAWVASDDQRIAQAVTSAADANTAAGNAQSTADKKITTYYQNAAPTGTFTTGDLWVDGDDSNHLYRWDGSAWASVRDATIAAAASAASAAQTAANDAMTAAQTAQSTADGAIRTYYQSTAPWAAGATGHDNDLGDLWYDTAHEVAHRWDGSQWAIIQDDSISAAMSAAQNAQTTADGKITAYYQTAQPTVGDLGDLWYDTDDNNKPYYCSSTSPLTWTTVQDGTIAIAQAAAAAADSKAANAQSTADTAVANAQTAQTTADGKATTYFQTTAPTGLVAGDVGDLWFDTDDGNIMYRWDGTQWVVSDDQRISQAVTSAADANTAAGNAQSTADRKITTYYQTAAPTGTFTTGDLWVDTDDSNHLYRWSGTAWADARDATIAAAAASASAAQTAANNAMTAAQNAQSTADGKVSTYYQSAAPWADGATGHDTDLGDLWYDTTNQVAHRWDGSTWATIQDTSISAAMSAAQNAQSTADGKITSYYTSPAPATASVDDLWYDTSDSNHPYYWDGTQWVDLRDGTIYTIQTAQSDLTDTVTNHGTALDDLTTRANSTDTTLNNYMSATDTAISTLQGGYDILNSLGNAGVEEDYMWVGDNPDMSTVKLVQISAFVQAAIGAGDGPTLAAALGLVSAADMGDVEFQTAIPPMTTFYNCFTAAGLSALPWNA